MNYHLYSSVAEDDIFQYLTKYGFMIIRKTPERYFTYINFFSGYYLSFNIIKNGI